MWLMFPWADRIIAGLNDVRKALKKNDAPPFDDTLGTYADWSRAVGRYSFRWHLRADA